MHPILGPKCSIYYAVISVWGIIMLALMAISFKVRSPLLFEDAKVDEGAWAAHNHSTEYIQEQYDAAAANCGIACCLYLVLFIFSFVQWKLNTQRSELQQQQYNARE